MKALLGLLALVAASLLLAACASTKFYPHESRDNSYMGKGGSRFTTEGMDVWFIGEPDRKYMILGYIEDEFNPAVDERHQSVSDAVLKKAREIGADALIEVVTQTRTGSSISTGGMFGGRHSGVGMGIGFGVPLSEQKNARYTAIRYLN
ncbi:hypothetical protein Q9Q94_17300 [Uliginosibacterium sp. 31-16]|uniref:hypothetical protein n=1 Tax=Uliginosibacterium sp. 31-16 TaxID=3068315 RepID=UPI00273FA9F7|nr:hypothetical protein [Uliginosibacterium sp. 31-16]MDP5241299.1 hypothetical protein [Uliginosibacterium sp. 31-16]